MTEKPSLHEIAAMPFPASVNAMRKFYNADWGKDCDGAKRKFEVRVEYHYSGYATETIEVEAFSQSEAEELASDDVGDDLPHDADIDISKAEAVEVEE